jgi:hypothetical protein
MPAKIAALFVTVLGLAPHWKDVPEPPSPVPEVRVFLDLPKPFAADARVALRNWDRALKSWHRIVEVTRPLDANIVIDEVAIDDVWIESDDRLLGWTYTHGSRIHLVEFNYEFDVAGIVSHELGHVFGAEHEDGTIMSEFWHARQECPDMTTIRQVAEYHGLDFTRLGYCYWSK